MRNFFHFLLPVMRLLPFILAGLLIFLYYSGINAVPFHPDESTYIFMATDFENFLHAPEDLTYRADSLDAMRQRYRLIDTPLTRYLIGFGLAITGQEPLRVDWDWSRTWRDNELAGALPDQQTLIISRLSVSAVFGLTLLLAYQTSQQLHGRLAGAIAMLLLGLNALVLLHTRRAMAESATIFTIYLLLWLIPKGGKFPLFLGLAAGLALCAKQSTLPTIAVAALSVVSLPADVTANRRKKRLFNLGIFSFTLSVVYLALNPVFWPDLPRTILLSLELRQDLLLNQVNDWGNFSILSKPILSLVLFINNLFYNPPAFAEATNYLQATAAAEIAYQRITHQVLFRNLTAGSVMLALFSLGVYINARHYHQQRSDKRKIIFLYLTGTIFQSFFILFFLPIPWQRYVFPVLPYVILWTASAISTMLTLLINKLLPNVSIGEQTADLIN